MGFHPDTSKAYLWMEVGDDSLRKFRVCSYNFLYVVLLIIIRKRVARHGPLTFGSYDPKEHSRTKKFDSCDGL
jgi:hypothetical protein